MTAFLSRLPLWLHLTLALLGMVAIYGLMRFFTHANGWDGGYWTGVATMLWWGVSISWRPFR